MTKELLDIGQQDIPVCAAADPVPHQASFKPPAKSCDCHAHIFGPEADYPYALPRSYTPPEASLKNYLNMLDVIGIERGVIVQPSVYGTDNRATLDATEQMSDRFRAVVVVDDDVRIKDLEAMHERGARGVRINLLFQSNARSDNLKRLADILNGLGWHMQLLIDVSKFADLPGDLGSLGCDLVFDHMGHAPADTALREPGFQQLLDLMKDGKAWAKLSGAYRFTNEDRAPYRDVEPIAKALIDANVERCVWASDWPHPHIPVAMPNDGDLLSMLADWAPDETVRHKILVDNPAKLYGFGS